MKSSGKKNIDKISFIKGISQTTKRESAEKAFERDSEDIKKIAEAKEIISMIPDIRTDVVSEIKNSVEERKYYRESKKVAKKVVDESIEIAKRKKY